VAGDLLYLPEVVKLNLGAGLFFTLIAVRCISSQPSAGVMAVKVTDPSSAAIPGAVLTIIRSSGEVRSVNADVAGEARASLPAGTYALQPNRVQPIDVVQGRVIVYRSDVEVCSEPNEIHRV
jgi:hypothetical protein